MVHFEINPVTNPRRDRSYWATLSTEEPLHCHSADCGVAGNASIVLRYQPTEQCIETRSFGRYLSHLLRDTDLDQDLLQQIVTDVLSSCHPEAVAVEAHFESPEGMAITLIAAHPESLK